MKSVFEPDWKEKIGLNVACACLGYSSYVYRGGGSDRLSSRLFVHEELN